MGIIARPQMAILCPITRGGMNLCLLVLLVYMFCFGLLIYIYIEIYIYRYIDIDIDIKIPISTYIYIYTIPRIFPLASRLDAMAHRNSAKGTTPDQRRVVTVTVAVISNGVLMGKLKKKTPWQNFRKKYIRCFNFRLFFFRLV